MLWASRYVLLTDQQHVHAGVSSHVLQGQPAKSAANRGLDWVRGCQTAMRSSFAIQQRPAAAMCMHEMEVQKDKVSDNISRAALHGVLNFVPLHGKGEWGQGGQ